MFKHLLSALIAALPLLIFPNISRADMGPSETTNGSPPVFARLETFDDMQAKLATFGLVISRDGMPKDIVEANPRCAQFTERPGKGHDYLNSAICEGRNLLQTKSFGFAWLLPKHGFPAYELRILRLVHPVNTEDTVKCIVDAGYTDQTFTHGTKKILNCSYPLILGGFGHVSFS